VRLTGDWKGPAFWYIHETMDAQWIVPGELANSKLQRYAADGRLKMLYGSDATRLHWAGNGFDGKVHYWSGISKAADPHLALSQRELRQKRGRRMILNVGMVGGRKGTRTLIEAFALGRAEGLIPPEVELCIIACGRPSVSAEARDIIRRVLQPDLRGHVRLVHSVLPDALDAYYDAADVYAHASLFDCMPIAILTAMARGLPIVSTDADGCKEAIVHESCGLVVQPTQPRQMAEALGTLFAQPDKARAFGAAARARFVECFSVEATFPPLYDTLVGHASTA
jgi:glycosyltransferase involved in cell wall biosynthesis